jgi:hypothetical protein
VVLGFLKSIKKIPRQLSMNNRNTRGITLVVAAAAALILFIWGEMILGNASVCIYYSIFGIPCPLCGLTRAVHELMHFRFSAAMDFNPLVYLLAGWFLLELAYYVWFSNKKLYTSIRYYRLALAAAALLMLVMRWFKYFPLP